MKKRYALLLLLNFFFGISFQAISQITIESKDVLILNTKIIMAYDTTGPNLNLGSTGSGQNWDFSNVTENDTDEDSVRIPQGTYGEYYFTNADIAIDEDDSGFVYISKNNSELIVLGFSNIEANGDTSHQDFNVKIITFPSSLGTKFTSDGGTVEYGFEFNTDPDGPGPHPFVDSLGLISTISVASEMDAEGSLKTKTGSYNALRQNVINYQIDSIFMKSNGKWTLISPLMSSVIGSDSVDLDTSTTYRFWAEALSFPVVEIEYDMAGGVITEIQWLKDIAIGYNEPVSVFVDLKIYPNPADSYLHVQTDLKNLVIEINDLQGRRIERNIVSGNAVFKVNHLENGIYMLNVLNESGNLLQSKMIQIQH